MPNDLPAGYSSRPATLDDAQAGAELLNICRVQLGVKAEVNAEQLSTDLQAPGFDPERDSLLIHAGDGQLAGMALLFDKPPHVRPYAAGHIHPLHQGRGLGTFLAEWIERRARGALNQAPPDAEVVLIQERLHADAAARALLVARGYENTRVSLRMERDLSTDEIEAPAPIPGVTIRPMVFDSELCSAVATICEAFRDHWGWVERPLADEMAEWRHYFETAADADPSLWYVATDNGRIVATCACHPTMGQDPDMAYIYGLAVLRSWRRRGIAQSLLRMLFRELRSRGKRSVELSVDAQNLTGATRLYERAGMHVVHQDDVYELVLRPGRDLTTQGRG